MKNNPPIKKVLGEMGAVEMDEAKKMIARTSGGLWTTAHACDKGIGEMKKNQSKKILGEIEFTEMDKQAFLERQATYPGGGWSTAHATTLPKSPIVDYHLLGDKT